MLDEAQRHVVSLSKNSVLVICKSYAVLEAGLGLAAKSLAVKNDSTSQRKTLGLFRTMGFHVKA